MAKLAWKMAHETAWKDDCDAKNLAILSYDNQGLVATVTKRSPTRYVWRVNGRGHGFLAGASESAQDVFEAIEAATGLEPDPLYPGEPVAKAFLG